jgi:PAS domain S-box-containing protein
MEPIEELSSPSPAPGIDARHIAAAVLVADAERRILHVEGGAFAAHGLLTQGWIGLIIDEILPAGARPVLVPRYAAALAGESQSFHYWTQDGRGAYLVQLTPIRDDAGAVRSVIAVMQDITERLRVTSELALSEARLREAERMAGIGSWELEVAGGAITYSAGMAELLGITDGRPLDRDSHLEFVHPEDRERVAAIGEQCVRTGSDRCEYRVVRTDGAPRIFSLRAELVPPEPGEPLYLRGAVLDVTEQRAAEREGLAAEALFRQAFDEAPIGMTLAAPAGGECLRVNDAMCRLLGRSREELLGQTIASVTPAEDHVDLQRARQEMLRGECGGFKSEQRYVRADGTVSWGLLHMTPVRAPDGSVRAFHSQIVDITDRKEHEARLAHDVGEALWLGRIRDALDQDRLLLYAQPIVDLITGNTVQYELLLRMCGEDGSIIAPGEFLPAAERYGLIAEIDRWVIRQAVEIAAQGTPTEFNLSGRSITDPNVLRELAAALEETGADPSLLVVEVTETAFVGQTVAGRIFAERVRELGCRLALDDFGTGFSSLSYLKHLPADHLKIDIEFVRELTSSDTDARVVRGIVGLAREFNQTTIAEGVEDEATLIRLRELGVDMAQGYLLGRPAPRDCASGRLEPARRSVLPYTDDAIGIVRRAFAAFARRDLDAMLSACHPDLILRPLVTARQLERSAPYCGHEGLRAYVRDVETVWDELTLTPLTFRQAEGSVIGFGQADARRGPDRRIASILWVVRLQDGKIASLEVFQAVDGTESMSRAQLERLQDEVAAVKAR